MLYKLGVVIFSLFSLAYSSGFTPFSLGGDQDKGKGCAMPMQLLQKGLQENSESSGKKLPGRGLQRALPSIIAIAAQPVKKTLEEDLKSKKQRRVLNPSLLKEGYDFLAKGNVIEALGKFRDYGHHVGRISIALLLNNKEGNELGMRMLARQLLRQKNGATSTETTEIGLLKNYVQQAFPIEFASISKQEEKAYEEGKRAWEAQSKFTKDELYDNGEEYPRETLSSMFPTMAANPNNSMLSDWFSSMEHTYPSLVEQEERRWVDTSPRKAIIFALNNPGAQGASRVIRYAEQNPAHRLALGEEKITRNPEGEIKLLLSRSGTYSDSQVALRLEAFCEKNPKHKLILGKGQIDLDSRGKIRSLLEKKEQDSTDKDLLEYARQKYPTIFKEVESQKWADDHPVQNLVVKGVVKGKDWAKENPLPATIVGTGAGVAIVVLIVEIIKTIKGPHV